jgi:anti-sigma regulatory factor (Ser/Thr protein kinase)
MSGMATSRFSHQAFLYGSEGEFVATMAPLIRDGLRRGDAIFAATKRPNIDALQEELGDDAGRVELHDTNEWQTRPYDRLQAFKRIVEGLPEGGFLRAMVEPVWEGSEATVRQWARYESVINLALAGSPMLFICLYDRAALPDHILDYAGCTHPERVQDGARVSCAAFVAPEEFLPGLPAAPPEAIAELPLESGSFRQLLAQRALEEGLRSERVDELVLAAHEVATNALTHGRRPVRARVWAQGEEIVCQIVDSGPGISDPLAGWLPPAPAKDGGWGLPIARQLCDVVEIVPSETETTVSLYQSLGRATHR